MRHLLDLSHPIASGIPAWAEMAGTFGLARTLVNTWEGYEETGFLRTHGKVKELYRTCLVMVSDNGATHVDGTRHFDPLGEWAPEIPLAPFYGLLFSSMSATSSRSGTIRRPARSWTPIGSHLRCWLRRAIGAGSTSNHATSC